MVGILTHRLTRTSILTALLFALATVTNAQTFTAGQSLNADQELSELMTVPPVLDTVTLRSDSISLLTGKLAAQPVHKKRDWNTWRPSPQRAMWLAIVIPGGGQIYNRKYWKLPLVYGGFLGCAYAMAWNNQMYRDYSQAYLDLMDDDPNTQSYNQFMHLGAQINASNQSRYQALFKSRKDRFRRWRDLSFFCLVGVYALSVVDAYVDASLSEFDISDDLSLRIEPTVIDNHQSRNPFKSGTLGVSCNLCF